MDLNQSVVDLWWRYEQVAMHFNELIIQYRLQLMGGAGLVGTLSSYFIGSHVRNAERRHTIRAYVATVVLILLSAGAALDLFYYNELLLGAVDALKQFESEHPAIYMSTAIDKRFSAQGVNTLYLVYGIILVPLAIFTVWSWYALVRERNCKALKIDKRLKNG